MNYIEWELLRQRESLARLLAGGKTEETVDGEVPSGTGKAMETAESGAVARFRAMETERARLMTDAPETGAEADGSVFETGTVPVGRAALRRPSGTDALPAAETGGAGGFQRELSGGLDALAVLSGGETTPVETLYSARAVSRCAERDARRYDGGYPLY